MQANLIRIELVLTPKEWERLAHQMNLVRNRLDPGPHRAAVDTALTQIEQALEEKEE